MTTIDITLNLNELISLEYPQYYPTGGVTKGAPGTHKVFKTSNIRPLMVLELVKKKFAPIISFVKIRLGNKSSFNGRFLVAKYVSGLSGSRMGRGAQLLVKNRFDKFTPDEIKEKDVTAYIYEGAIYNQLFEFNIPLQIEELENVYAISICHELGHNLGLQHVKSPFDIMFRYGDANDSDKHTWLNAVKKDKLVFTPKQLQTMVSCF